MKELEEMKKQFDAFMVTAEAFTAEASIEWQKEEKPSEEWPKIGDKYFFRNTIGDIGNWIREEFDHTDWRIKNLLIFRTEEAAKRYYFIIDTINNIVDELGAPTWEDFEDGNHFYSVYYGFTCGKLQDDYCHNAIYSTGIFPLCKVKYLEALLEKVREEDLLWAFKKSMRLVK